MITNHPELPANNFCLSVMPDSSDDAKRIFDALSVNGIVTKPLEIDVRFVYR